MTRCKHLDCGWCYRKTGNSNDVNGKCMSPNECQQLASQQQPQQHSAIEDKVMSNEKMREEFEAWYEGIAGSSVEFNDGGIPVATGGALSGNVTIGMWLAWKASRAALCVELPKTTEHETMDNLVNIKHVKQALDFAGVHYK